jgi:hypothetical protein
MFGIMEADQPTPVSHPPFSAKMPAQLHGIPTLKNTFASIKNKFLNLPDH